LKNTFVLVTAHYDHLGGRASNEGDHIYNGANDDASGTASVIEIAAALASLPEKPKRSIVFMTFFGEEVGRLGSRYYSRHPLVPLAKTVAQVNLEHLGRTDGESVPRVGQAKVLGFDYSSATDVLRDAAEEVGVQLVNDKEHSATYYGVTDCRPLAEVGVPAVTLSIGMAPDYHLPSDEWQKQDYDNMAKLARAAALGVYRLAESSEAPQWNGQNPQTERYRRAREEAAGGSGVK
jgi:Zn-dependent M28 family amino/carboxypeptidase